MLGNTSPQYVVAIGASAGGVTAIAQVLSGLPADFPAAILVVLHLSPHYKSHLSQLFARRTKLKVEQARQGQPLHRGTVYVAPPNHHLEVGPDHRIHLNQEPRINFTRPSADPLFSSVARQFGPKCVLVILTGTGRNGSTALPRAKQHGSHIVAQDERSSRYFGMPGAAIRTGCVDEVLPLQEISPRLSDLCRNNEPP